ARARRRWKTRGAAASRFPHHQRPLRRTAQVGCAPLSPAPRRLSRGRHPPGGWRGPPPGPEQASTGLLAHQGGCVLLKATHADLTTDQRLDALYAGGKALDGRDARDAHRNCGGADLIAVEPRVAPLAGAASTPERRVHD